MSDFPTGIATLIPLLAAVRARKLQRWGSEQARADDARLPPGGHPDEAADKSETPTGSAS